MKKILFVLAFVGASMFSNLEAKEKNSLTINNTKESALFCKVVTSTTRQIFINSDGSSTEVTTTTRTFYPCSN